MTEVRISIFTCKLQSCQFAEITAQHFSCSNKMCSSFHEIRFADLDGTFPKKCFMWLVASSHGTIFHLDNGLSRPILLDCNYTLRMHGLTFVIIHSWVEWLIDLPVVADMTCWQMLPHTYTHQQCAHNH